MTEGSHAKDRQKGVHFDDCVEVRLCENWSHWNVALEQSDFANWSSKPWGITETPSISPWRQTYKITGECDPPDVPGRLDTVDIQGHQVRPPHLPAPQAWINEAWPRFVTGARLYRRHEGPSAYCRTWYIHHTEIRTWLRWREFQLTDDVAQWEVLLTHLWRDQVRAGQEMQIHWITPPVPEIPGWESHLGDIVLVQGHVPERAAILCRTTSILDHEDRLTLQAFSVPSRQPRPDLLLINHIAILCWSHDCTITRGSRILRDGMIDHIDGSGIHILVTPQAINAGKDDLRDLISDKQCDHEGGCDGPLSFQAVSTSSHRIDDVPVNTWKLLHPRRETQADEGEAATPPEGQSSDEHPGSNEEDDEEESPPYVPPEVQPAAGHEDNIQSVLLYQINRPERHAFARWHSHAAMLRSVAEILTIDLHEIYELHDIGSRPANIAAEAYPMIVQKHGDVSPGALQKIVLLDLLIHEQHSMPTIDRKAIRLPSLLTRHQLLREIRIDRYCASMDDRCIVKKNDMLWAFHDDMPRPVEHGTYLQVHVPPSEQEDIPTAQAIWSAQSGCAIPTLEDEFPAKYCPQRSSSSASIESPTSPASMASVATPPVETIHDDLLDMEDDDFIPDLFDVWEQEAVTEQEEQGPVAYFATWYLSGRTLHRCHQSRHVALLQDHRQWLRQLANLWQDHIDLHWPLTYYFVQPDPPESAMTANLAGHIIMAQHLRPHQRATHMTVIRADYEDHHHITWAMITTSRANKPLLFGWHLVDAVCPPMRTRNVCRCYTGDREIGDGDELDVHQGQSFHTLVERADTAAPRDEAATSLRQTGAQRRHQEDHSTTEHNDEDEGNYPGVAEFPAFDGSGGPRALSLQELVPQAETCIVRLIPGGQLPGLPPFIELPRWYNEITIYEELTCWGYYVNVLRFGLHDVALCVPHPQPVQDTSEKLVQHYLYCNIDATDASGAFAHTDVYPYRDHDHMKLLHQMGYQRAAVIHEEDVGYGYHRIHFQDVRAEIEDKPDKKKICSEWPEPQPVQQAPRKITDKFAHLVDNETAYQLRLRRSIPELCALLRSGHDCLQHDLDHVELPSHVQHALEACDQHQVGIVPDRYVIYTDGSSQTANRRLVPDQFTTSESLSDTWAFVILGETYATPTQPRRLCLLGWQAHPILYEDGKTHALGSSRIGSDVAEREALFWAMLWRLGQDNDVATCFRPDNLTAMGQAQGLFGAQHLDETFRALRGVGQALESMLPGPALQFSHVRGHSDEPWNDLADLLAKAEARKSQYCPRQPVDLRLWLQELPFLFQMMLDFHHSPTRDMRRYHLTCPQLTLRRSLPL